MEFADPGAFAAYLRECAAAIPEAGQIGLADGAKLVLAEVKAELGNYQSGDAGFDDMAPLSPATLEGWDAVGGRLEGKIERGYASAGSDNPLRATGELGESFGLTVTEGKAEIGSNDPVAIYQNQGTKSRGVPFVPGATTEPGISAREFIGRAAFRKASEVIDAVAAPVLAVLGINFDRF